jgi:L-asparagine transporter-like permease
MGISYMIALGNLGGVIGSMVFLGDEKPRYQTGWSCCLAFIILGMCSALTLEMVYKYTNKKRDAMDRQEIEAKYTVEQLDAMGDRSPLFRYTL